MVYLMCLTMMIAAAVGIVALLAITWLLDTIYYGLRYFLTGKPRPVEPEAPKEKTKPKRRYYYYADDDEEEKDDTALWAAVDMMDSGEW